MAHSEDKQAITENPAEGVGVDTITMTDGGSNPAQLLSKKVKIIKMCCMFLVYFGSGISVGVLSPTSVDMAQLYQCDIHTFVSVTSVKPLGIIAGSFTGSLAANRFKSLSDLSLFMFTLVQGITLTGMPWAPNLGVMGLLIFVNGLCLGSINIVCNTLNLSIWGESAPTPLHLCHMFVTLGMALSPPITIPFLSNDYRDDTWTNSTSNSTTYTGNVKIPYAIFGIWSAAVSFIFLVFFLRGSKSTTQTDEKKASLRDMLQLGKIANGDFKFALYFVISLFFLYFCVNGRDRGLSMYLFIIAHTDVLQMSKPMSAGLVTAGIVCVTIGRALAGLLSRWVNIKLLVLAQLGIGCYIQMLMMFYALKSTTMLWILTCLFGIVTGPTYSGIMGWANRYVETSGLVLAVIDVGLGVGACVSLIFNGNLYDTHGALGVFVLEFIYGVAILLIFIPLQIVSYYHGDRHKQVNPFVYTINEQHSELDNIYDDDYSNKDR